MAKKYIKPAFQFHQIPLVVGGGTGCARNSTQAEYICAVYDEDLECTIFSSRDICDRTGNNGSVCYTVPVADYNIYNS